MIDLANRSDEKEFIDDPHLNAALRHQADRGLRTINLCTLGYWPTMSAVKFLLERRKTCRPVTVLDIGCGEGEILRRIGQYGQTRKLALELTGIDLSPDAIVKARQHNAFGITFLHGDVFSYTGKPYDIIINSLTMHHFTDQQIVRLVQWMTAHAQIGWAISDLNRHVFAYYFAVLFVRLARLNAVVAHDAPVSVARSFSRKDWVSLLTQAGIDFKGIRISWYPNFRYGIRYEKLL